jgi:hypothetical protein
MKGDCSIDFDFEQEKHFKDLLLCFEKLKEAKNTGQPRPDKFWLDLFPDYALKNFWFSEADIKSNILTGELGDFTWHFFLIKLCMRNVKETRLSDNKKENSIINFIGLFSAQNRHKLRSAGGLRFRHTGVFQHDCGIGPDDTSLPVFYKRLLFLQTKLRVVLPVPGNRCFPAD